MCIALQVTIGWGTLRQAVLLYALSDVNRIILINAYDLLRSIHLTHEWVVNLSRAFCDPGPRSYQIMSAAQHLALINTIRIRA